MLILGLTGGMGSGKSEAARLFRDAGIPVIDADAVGHGVLAAGGAAESEVLAAFGEDILTDGIIDRKKLGRVVFDDPSARRKLNALTHPKIEDAIVERADELEASGHGVVLVEAALWGEDGTLPDWMDGLILISCPEALRIERVVRARGMAKAEAARRVAAQRAPEEKRGIAAYVIENGGSLDALKSGVEALARKLYGGPDRT